MAKDIRIENPPIAIKKEVERLAKLGKRTIPKQALLMLEEWIAKYSKK